MKTTNKNIHIRGKINKMSKVNLDALIPRADFIEDSSTIGATDLKYLNIQHLMPKSLSPTSKAHLFRKPDFQRETNNWDKKRISDLIESYINGAFIPSIILWQNPDNKMIYVIDGAHRLSAILAWINNDYGDSLISKEYYKYTPIPDEESELANITRIYVDSKVGAFTELMNNGGTKWDSLINREIDIQIIQGGVNKAQESFFKINQQGVVLSATEKQLCNYRGEPESIATRIILRGGGLDINIGVRLQMIIQY